MPSSKEDFSSERRSLEEGTLTMGASFATRACVSDFGLALPFFFFSERGAPSPDAGLGTSLGSSSACSAACSAASFASEPLRRFASTASSAGSASATGSPAGSASASVSSFAAGSSAFFRLRPDALASGSDAAFFALSFAIGRLRAENLGFPEPGWGALGSERGGRSTGILFWGGFSF